MIVSFDQDKRESNWAKHGLDLADGGVVLRGLIMDWLDDREIMENKSDMKPGLPVDADEAPTLDDRFFANARVRIGSRILRKATDTAARRGRPPKGTLAKVQQSLRLSPEVLEYFRSTGDGWQARIDDLLLAHVHKQRDKRAA